MVTKLGSLLVIYKHGDLKTSIIPVPLRELLFFDVSWVRLLFFGFGLGSV